VRGGAGRRPAHPARHRRRLRGGPDHPGHRLPRRRAPSAVPRAGGAPARAAGGRRLPGAGVPGRFFTGLPATQAFGPFFGFVAGCRVAPRRIVERIRAAGGAPGAHRRPDGSGILRAGAAGW
jgi:hypothetical protein